MNLFQLNHKPFGIFKEILHSNAIHFIVANKKIQWVIVSYDLEIQWVIVSYDCRISWVVSYKRVSYRNGLCVIFPKLWIFGQNSWLYDNYFDRNKLRLQKNLAPFWLNGNYILTRVKTSNKCSEQSSLECPQLCVLICYKSKFQLNLNSKQTHIYYIHTSLVFLSFIIKSKSVSKSGWELNCLDAILS